MAQAGLVSREDLASFLRVDINHKDTTEVLDPLRTAVTAFFERLCDRARAPFSDPITGRVEWQDGTGSPDLWLDYPVSSISEVLIGRTVSAPRETLAVADPETLAFDVGASLIRRVDGGTFGDMDEAHVVRVTYTTADDRPGDAQLAVMRLCAQLYRQRGSEDAATENTAGYSRVMADMAATDQVWSKAVDRHRRVAFR